MNERVVSIEKGDPIAVTGAAGFIGSAVVRALARRGAVITTLLEPGAPRGNLEGITTDVVVGDVRDMGAVREFVHGAKLVFHLAARFGFWPRDPRPFYDINVVGSRNVVTAAAEAGVERVCYTSSVATLGLWDTKGGSPADETSFADIVHLHGNYKRSKYVAEHEVLRLGAEGARVVLVQPTMPHGPYDHRPTPSGKVVLDYLNAKMPGYVDTAMNVAHVDDLAEGHLRAVEFGRQGRSYICGGENLSMRELLETLSSVTGLPASSRRFPSALPIVAGRTSELVEGTLMRREPHVPLEAAQMAATHMIFNDDRARSELGYTSRPASHALYDSAKWFVEHAYVDQRRVAAIDWNAPH